MISVISCTDRKSSRTSIVAGYYKEVLESMDSVDVQYLNLESLKTPFLLNNNYNADSQSEQLVQIQDKFFIGADKWILVLPEYNGGLPGIFKYIFDGMSIREKDKTFSDKKVCLVGVAAGRAGNLRGLDYASNILHYLKAHVYHHKLPISLIETLLENDQITNVPTQEVIQAQVNGFINF